MLYVCLDWQRGWRAERDYLTRVCNEFHARISWRLEDHEEPEEPLPEYDQFAQVPEEELDDEEMARKRLKIDTMNSVSLVDRCVCEL